MNKFLYVVGLGFGLMTSACMSEDTDVADDGMSDVESALSTSWPYPVPTGCVALASNPSRCQTNVGHYDVVERATVSMRTQPRPATPRATHRCAAPATATRRATSRSATRSACCRTQTSRRSARSGTAARSKRRARRDRVAPRAREPCQAEKQTSVARTVDSVAVSHQSCEISPPMRAVGFAISMLSLQGCAATHASAPVAPATLSRPDPTVTDPENYKVSLENDRVRVLRYHDVPGTKTHLHHHPASVLCALSTFERRLTFGNGTSQERVLHDGDVMWPAQDHLGENIGTTPTDVLLVELKAR